MPKARKFTNLSTIRTITASATGAGEVENGRGERAAAATLKSRDPKLRAGAAERLGVAGDKRYGAVLTQHVSDRNASVRSAVVEALGLLRYRPATNELAHVLVSDRSPLIRVLAAEALGAVGVRSAKVRNALINAMNNDHSPLVRAYAAESLAALHSRESVPAIRQRLSPEASTRARVSMLQALSQLGDEQAFKRLLRSLRGSSQHGMQTQILNSLEGILADSRSSAYVSQAIQAIEELQRRDPTLVENPTEWRRKYLGPHTASERATSGYRRSPRREAIA